MSIKVEALPTQLTWSDFKVVKSLPDGSGEEAQTATQMPAMSGIHAVAKNGIYSLPDLTLKVGLDRSQTMVIQTAHKTVDLLKHEQGHFDITVLTVKAMAAEWEQATASSNAGLGQQINAILRRHQQRASALTDKYDSDTNNSKNKTAQATWNQAIDAAMKNKEVSTLHGQPL